MAFVPSACRLYWVIVFQKSILVLVPDCYDINLRVDALPRFTAPIHVRSLAHGREAGICSSKDKTCKHT